MKKEIRILNLMLSSGLGGMEDMGFVYGKTLQEKYFCLNVFSPKSKMKQKLMSLKYVNFIKTVCQFDIIAAIKLSMQIAGNRITHLILHGRRAQKIALMSKIFIKNPPKLIFIDHNNFHTKDFSKMDEILAISDERYNFLQKDKTIKHVDKICNFINLNDFKILKREKNGEIVFGWMARFHKVKGICMLFDAIKSVQKSGISARFLIAGGTLDDLRKFGDIFNGIDLSKIEFVGWVNDISTFYEKIDCFLSTSFDEPFGLTMLYSLAYSIPVIATPTQGPLEVLKKIDNGSILLNEISSEEIFKGIEKFYNMSEDDKNFMSKQAGQIAKKFYSQCVFLDNIDKILRNI